MTVCYCGGMNPACCKPAPIEKLSAAPLNPNTSEHDMDGKHRFCCYWAGLAFACPDCGGPCNRFTPPGDICECTIDCEDSA